MPRHRHIANRPARRLALVTLAALGIMCSTVGDVRAHATTVRTVAQTTAAVASGVTFTHSTVQIDGRQNQIFTIAVDVHVAGLNVVAAHGLVNSPGETVLSMAQRTDAVAALNGDVFDLISNRTPYGGEVSGSAILKTPTPGSPDQFYLLSNHTAGIGAVNLAGMLRWSRVIMSKGHHLTIKVARSYASINNMNVAAAGQLTLVSPAYGAGPSPSGCVLAAMTMTAKGLRVTGYYRTGSWIAQMASNRRYLIGCGRIGTWLRQSLPVGTYVANSATLRAVGSPSSVHVTALIGGPRILVVHGVAHTDRSSVFATYGRNPESWTCVDRTGRYVQLGALDGRIWGSDGVTLAQLTGFLVSEGCYNGIVLDGGGSTASLASLGGGGVQVQDQPATGGWGLRPLANAVLVYPGVVR